MGVGWGWEQRKIKSTQLQGKQGEHNYKSTQLSGGGGGGEKMKSTQIQGGGGGGRGKLSLHYINMGGGGRGREEVELYPTSAPSFAIFTRDSKQSTAVIPFNHLTAIRHGEGKKTSFASCILTSRQPQQGRCNV